jgi:hypothetical protein
VDVRAVAEGAERAVTKACSEVAERACPDPIEQIVQWALAEAEIAPRRRPLPWSEREDQFLRRYLGVLSEEEIGAALGRTQVAVRLRWKRDLGLPAPSKTPGYVTANQAARMLTVDVHTVCRWIERGWLRAQQLPFQGRKVWRIHIEDLKRFAIKPEHWMLFRPERVHDPTLACLVTLAVERWNDEWLAPGQVAEMHGVDHRDVNRYIRAGKLPGVKWGNWWIRRSDAEQVCFHKGRGTGHELDWSEEGDAFLVLARAVGLSLTAIGRLMDWPPQRVGPRLMTLHRTKQIPLLIDKYGLEGVQYRPKDRGLLVDWRLHRNRFPTLARAMDRFASSVSPHPFGGVHNERDRTAQIRQAQGKPLSPVEAECIRGVLWTWAVFHLDREHPLVRRLQVHVGRGRKRFPARLQTLYHELKAMGIDPLPDRKRITTNSEVRDASTL